MIHAGQKRVVFEGRDAEALKAALRRLGKCSEVFDRTKPAVASRQGSVRLVVLVCLGPSPAWLSSCRV
jgi:short subunit dehydrogenase-like uncharacterized protein